MKDKQDFTDITKQDVYGDVVYKIRKIMEIFLFSYIFTKIVKRFINKCYDPNILRDIARLVFTLLQ